MLMIKEGTEVHYFSIYSTGIVTQLDWNKKCTSRMSPLVAAAGWQWNKEMQIKLNEKFAIMEIAFIYFSMALYMLHSFLLSLPPALYLLSGTR